MTVAALIDPVGTETAVAGIHRPTPSPEVDQRVREHLPLVGHLVRGVLSRVPAHVGSDELVSAGMLALVLAAQSFDDSFGVPFAAFATIRIRGALTDALRSMDWAARTVRTKARQIQAVSDKLAAALRRTPTRAEIAQAMGVAVTEIDAVDADVRRGSVASIQALSPEAVEDSLPTTADSPETLLLKREQIGYLHDAIAELPERLRTVVEQYFFDQRRMAVIAEELGVTESRVSQLRSEALTMLRAAINGMDARPSGAKPAPFANPTHRTYAKAVGTRSTLADRLSLTTVLGEPRRELATLN